MSVTWNAGIEVSSVALTVTQIVAISESYGSDFSMIYISAILK